MIAPSISKILYRFKNHHFSESNYVNKILEPHLKHIYADPETTSKRSEDCIEEKTSTSNNFKVVIKDIKKEFRRTFSVNCPWIDNSLWNQIRSISEENSPNVISCGSATLFRADEVYDRSEYVQEFNNEVEISDRSSVNRYSEYSRRLSSNSINHFGLSGIKAARHLNIIPRYDNTIKIKNNRNYSRSVEETAKDTNSGWPFFKKKNDTVCVKDTKIWLKNFISNPSHHSLFKNSLFENNTSLFHRVQPSVENKDCEIKIRQVWCVPQRIIALEHYFFSKVLENVTKLNKSGEICSYSSGLNNYEISYKLVSKIRNMSDLDINKRVYSLDYSKYDSTIPNFAIDLFFSIVREHLNLNDSEDHAYDCLRCYTRNTPFFYNNSIYVKNKGIMSGTYITNLFDTWFNLTLWYLSKNTSKDLDDVGDYEFKDILEYLSFDDDVNNNFRNDISICGDDVIIYTTKKEIDVHRNICNSLGMKIEVKSSYDSDDDFFFLGREWNVNNCPIQSETYMICHIIVRTKYYSRQKYGDEFIDNLDVNRILSICLPLYNGLEFVIKYFGNWKPMKSFLKSNKDFTLLKDWPNSDYVNVERLDAFDWTKY